LQPVPTQSAGSSSEPQSLWSHLLALIVEVSLLASSVLLLGALPQSALLEEGAAAGP
jgi:hypothetical protein